MRQGRTPREVGQVSFVSCARSSEPAGVPREGTTGWADTYAIGRRHEIRRACVGPPGVGGPVQARKPWGGEGTAALAVESTGPEDRMNGPTHIAYVFPWLSTTTSCSTTETPFLLQRQRSRGGRGPLRAIRTRAPAVRAGAAGSARGSPDRTLRGGQSCICPGPPGAAPRGRFVGSRFQSSKGIHGTRAARPQPHA